MEAFGILIIVISVFIGIAYYLGDLQKKKEIRTKVTSLANNVIEITPREFFEMRNYRLSGQGRPQYLKQYNFAGVYIFLNKTKNMYYVGQAQKIFDRVNSHFTGKGNGDVYADYKYGDEFTIKMIDITKSGFSSLNELERHTISTYGAFANGYNKNRGNS